MDTKILLVVCHQCYCDCERYAAIDISDCEFIPGIGEEVALHEFLSDQPPEGSDDVMKLMISDPERVWEVERILNGKWEIKIYLREC